MDSAAVLDTLLPGVVKPEAFDLTLAVPASVPGWALCGLVDWIGALALGSASLVRLPSETGGAETMEIVYEPTLPGAQLAAVGDGQFRLRFGDPADLLTLTQSLGRPGAAWRSGARLVTVDRGVLRIDGEDDASPAAAGNRTAAADPVAVPPDDRLLALVPGQARGALPPPVALPGAATAEWVLAVVDFAARWGVSAEDPLPWPFLRPTAAVSPPLRGRAALLRPDGLIHVPPDHSGVQLWSALARLPTYPERPVAFRQHRESAPEESLPVLYRFEAEQPWEGDRLLDQVAREVVPTLAETGAVAIEAYVSEPATVRRQLAARLRQLVGDAVEVRVRSATKQAYHHAVEVLLPRLRPHARELAALEIEVPRFEPASDRIERPFSFVATVVPADGVLATELGLDEEAVTLVLGTRFAFTARDSAGVVLHTEAFEPLMREVDLGPIYPGLRASVETGGVRAVDADGRVLATWLCPTDCEVAYAAFQTALRDLVPRFGGEGATLPLFASLRVSATLSEPDEDLPVPWERFSPLEELHEDIYFGVLAAMDATCRRLSEGRLRAPGLIVPEVEQGIAGPTRVAVVVRASADSLQPEPEMRALDITALEAEAGRLVLQAGSAPPPGWALYPSILPPDVAVGLPDGLRVEPVNVNCRAALPTDPYGPDDVVAVCAGAAAATGALWWVEQESFGGRPIPVLAWWHGDPAVATSPPKLSQRRPCLLVVGGHHANEISACVSSVRLIHELQRRRPRTLVVVVPLENADGAALDRALRRRHPGWKLHAARFNALGHEFGGDGPDTPFGEARVRQAILRDFAVDALLDDHGVPAHEWAQPFAGRSSPPLFGVAYTYPSGLLYGIGADSPEVGALWARVAAELDADPALVAVHRRLWARYARYGVALSPEEFPSRLRDGWPFQVMRRSPRQFARVGLRFVTEVADEGAQGEQLQACIAAHLIADLVFAEALGARGKV